MNVVSMWWDGSLILGLEYVFLVSSSLATGFPKIEWDHNIGTSLFRNTVFVGSMIFIEGTVLQFSIIEGKYNKFVI